ncbi:F-box protein At3g44326 [Medicago truncatula]|uniref:F-box protein At3g44326 n=1 Tax=Medicago truncatula TaxID=3880 RepID=UPI000D2F1D15|nr:F-box protein At3g44326 [Medicago truncatula]
MSMGIFCSLDPDIIRAHILPRLDGTTLTILSCVSSELRHMICNNEDLWRNICTSTWPSLLLDPIANNVISTFPGGYRSFFSFNHHNNNSYSWYLFAELIHTIDIYLHGEPLLSRVLVGCLTTENTTLIYDSTLGPTIHIPLKEGWFDYLTKNLTLSWIVIDPTRKCAVDLFHSYRNPLWFTGSSGGRNMIQFGIGMTRKGQLWPKMDICKLELTFDCKGCNDVDGDWLQLHLRRVVMVNRNA